MKVAMCQTNIIWEDKEKNIEKCVEFIEQAKKAQHRINAIS